MQFCGVGDNIVEEQAADLYLCYSVCNIQRPLIGGTKILNLGDLDHQHVHCEISSIYFL